MPETQLASMFLGSADDGDDIDRGRPSGVGNIIHILDGQTDEVLGHINKKYVIDNEHERDLPSHKDYFRFTVLAENKHAEHLSKRNGLIVPGEDGELLEFRIFESIKYRDNEGLKIEVHALATYLDLKTQKIFDPHKTNSETALQHANLALAGTEWQVGQVDFKGIRTLTFDNPFNSYDYILRIAREFELEPRFYIKVDGNKITGRYVDLIERIGEFRGRTIEFGRDLQSIERKEDTSNIATALWVYGPEREDGSRLKVFVEDDEARQRWGRKGKHIIDYYEPQTENQDITKERLETLGKMELNKRINAVVTYEAEILDLENVPGLENKKIRFGDTIRIKDTKFNPPLYVEARVFNVKRDVFNKAKKTVQLGDYVEYTEEEVNAIWNQLRNEIRRRLDRIAIVTINSTAGNVFKNAQGTTELTARTFVNGAERDEDGTLYDYQWMRFDKDGNHDTNFYAEGKTITVTANDIDEKATYRVLVAYELEVINTAEITISNVFDGEDGEPGPPGPKGDIGQGVEDVTPQYYLSNSDSALIGGTWTETKPPYQKNKYLWTRNKITYKNPTEVEYTTPVLDDSWKAIERAEEAKEDAQEAKQEAEEAKQEAQQAQTTADGKNSVFTQPTAPPTAGRKIGDIWFDTSRDNLMHRFNGTQWVEAKWGEQSIVANSITANHIKSLVGLNVNDQFIVDSQGNVKFAGSLEGASGTFGKVSVVDGDMVLIDNTTGSETIINTGSNFLFDHSFEFIRPNVALEPVDPNNPYLASICSVDADSLTSYYGGWNNTNPSNARMVRAFNAESKHIYSGLNAIILRGQDYGIWDQICFIPEHARQTNALSFSAYVAPFEKTTYDVSVSLRIQLVNENGQWIQDLASTSYLIDHTKKYNWQRVSVTYKGSLNIGNNRLRVRLLLNNNTSDAMLLCDGVQLVPFEHPTLYESENSLYQFVNGIGEAPELVANNLAVTRYATIHDSWIGNAYIGKIESHVHNTLPLQNGWQNYGGSFASAAYTKTADGYVHLRGLIRNGAIGTVCGILPVGCRPYRTEIFAVNAGDGHFARITITTSGSVTVTSATTSNPPFISLSGISFRAEN